MKRLKKTADEFLCDSYSRAENQDMEIIQQDENTYLVFSQDKINYYVLQVDNDSETILDCTCPHYRYRLEEHHIPCKHIVKLSYYLNYSY